MNKLTPFALIIAVSTAQAGPMDHDTTLTILTGPQTAWGGVMAGLRIDMADGWKTYWRAPGDAGIPPQIQWGGSRNVESVVFHWPVPKVFNQDGMRSIGYHDTVTIPVEVFPNDAGDIRLSGTMNIGVCDEICVPVNLPFDTALPRDAGRNAAISAALINRPSTATEAAVGDVTCTLSPITDGLQITASIPVSNSGNEDLILETSDPYVWVSEPSVTYGNGMITATSDLIHVDGTGFAIDRSGVRITVLGQSRAVDIRGCTAP
jgi:DsbC/DsbD-like thiol-disulfide interchange protein